MQWSLLGSQRCPLAHAVDGVRCYCRAACVAHGAVGGRMQSMALTLVAVELRLAHGAVGGLMETVALTLAAVELRLAHGAVSVLIQSMAYDVTAVLLAWLTAPSACCTTAADSYQIAIPDRWSLSELSGAI